MHAGTWLACEQRGGGALVWGCRAAGTRCSSNRDVYTTLWALWGAAEACCLETSLGTSCWVTFLLTSLPFVVAWGQAPRGVRASSCGGVWGEGRGWGGGCARS